MLLALAGPQLARPAPAGVAQELGPAAPTARRAWRYAPHLRTRRASTRPPEPPRSGPCTYGSWCAKAACPARPLPRQMDAEVIDAVGDGRAAALAPLARRGRR